MGCGASQLPPDPNVAEKTWMLEALFDVVAELEAEQLQNESQHWGALRIELGDFNELFVARTTAEMQEKCNAAAPGRLAAELAATAEGKRVTQSKAAFVGYHLEKLIPLEQQDFKDMIEMLLNEDPERRARIKLLEEVFDGLDKAGDADALPQEIELGAFNQRFEFKSSTTARSACEAAGVVAGLAAIRSQSAEYMPAAVRQTKPAFVDYHLALFAPLPMAHFKRLMKQLLAPDKAPPGYMKQTSESAQHVSTKKIEHRLSVKGGHVLERQPTGTLTRTPTATLVRTPTQVLEKTPSAAALERTPTATLVRSPTQVLEKTLSAAALERTPTATLVRTPTQVLEKTPSAAALERTPTATLVRTPTRTLSRQATGALAALSAEVATPQIAQTPE